MFCVSPKPKNTDNVVLVHHGLFSGFNNNMVRELC